MKNKLWYLFLALILMQSCASILTPKKQHVTIKTGDENATVYINNKKIGSGAIVKTKLRKNWKAKQIRIEVPGYTPQYYAAIQVKKSPLHFLSFTPIIALAAEPFIIRAVDPEDAGKNGELVLLFPVTAGIAALDMFSKSVKYEKIINTPIVYKEKIRSDNEKYISSFDLNFGSAEYPVRYYEVKYKDYKKNLSKEIRRQDNNNARDNKYKPALYYQVKKEANTPFFKNELDSVLKKSKFIDSTDLLFNNYNDVINLSCTVNTVNYYNVYRPHLLINTFPNNFISASSNITWYIRNNYNEIIKAQTIESESGQFSPNYYTTENDTLQHKLVNNLLLNSFEKLMMDSSVSSLLIKNKVTQKLPATATLINKTDSIVNSITDAKLASLIIKTKSGYGSGFAISNDGFIVTNYHVIAGDLIGKPADAMVITPEGEHFKATIIQYNVEQDLALLKIDKVFEKCFQLPSAKNYKIGNSVYSISSPVSIELSQSVGKGIISNDRISDTNLFIQLNMNINPGDSGGGIFNETGHKLIGIVDYKLTGNSNEGTAFCFPAYKIAEYLNITLK